MARYHLVSWKDIPALVEARDGDETIRVPLSPRFQELIDAVAMREGLSDGEAYLEGWGQGPDLERPGTAAEVARAVAAEVEAAFPALAAGRLPRST